MTTKIDWFRSTFIILMIIFAGGVFLSATRGPLRQTVTSLETTSVVSDLTVSQISTTISTTTLTTVGAVPQSSPPRYYIGISGIVGEASVLNYSGLIALNSWGFGPPKSYCSPGPVGAANCTSVETTINFTSTTGKASPVIQHYAAQGTEIPTAVLIGVSTVAGQQTVVVKLHFAGLFVSSYSTFSQNNISSDLVTMVFAKMTVS